MTEEEEVKKYVDQLEILSKKYPSNKYLKKLKIYSDEMDCMDKLESFIMRLKEQYGEENNLFKEIVKALSYAKDKPYFITFVASYYKVFTSENQITNYYDNMVILYKNKISNAPEHFEIIPASLRQPLIFECYNIINNNLKEIISVFIKYFKIEKEDIKIIPNKNKKLYDYDFVATTILGTFEDNALKIEDFREYLKDVNVDLYNKIRGKTLNICPVDKIKYLKNKFMTECLDKDFDKIKNNDTDKILMLLMAIPPGSNVNITINNNINITNNNGEEKKDMVSIIRKYVEINKPKSEISAFEYYKKFIKENLGYIIKRNNGKRYWSKKD